MTIGTASRSLIIVVLALLTVPQVAADSAVVLMYHRFGEDRFPSTNIRVEQFEAQLEHLQEAGYTIVPLADVVSALTQGTPLPDRAVAISIDDAYRSVYDVAFPRFSALGYPFTVFVATDAIDERLPAYMSWEQMREMAAAGAAFANHGAAHTSVIERLAAETDTAWLARVRVDIEKGARRLSEELDPLDRAFAYPYGEFNSAVGDLLEEMGYVGFGQHSGAVGPDSDTRALPRYPMAESFGDLGQFRTKVASLPMPVIEVDPWDPVTSATRPTVTVTLRETEARLDELACYVGGQGRVDVAWQEPARRFTVGPLQPFRPGRQRVNCTAPRNDGRYVWFSHPWFVRPQ